MSTAKSFWKIWPSTYFAGAVLLLSLLLPSPQNGQILGVGSICTFKNVFGIPCPGCGLTRSFVAIARGQWAESFAWHPLGPLLWLGVAIYFVASLYFALFRAPFRVSMRLQLGAVLGVLLALFAVWILRLNGAFFSPATL
mgnify:CR=1 FL=1